MIILNCDLRKFACDNCNITFFSDKHKTVNPDTIFKQYINDCPLCGARCYEQEADY